ncbi:MFS general substrate transporter [Ascoidea rubescens DSM 1968]|uniref:MFS general substrate transporter n=1 Tax=Ascoidea rubescens DSM 1968 TaxID=1344418 RepID=A0A1D2VJN3_9ASCO|nr:MFS general substrate transporter [Ascoidea rubescens DSM 1968]ODV61825.1 MFS general substrate transporter [Ascoidea rubescens DSM 1968]
MLDPPPDGGYGWVCAICVHLINLSSWGGNCSFGVFLSHYLESDSFHGADKFDFALVGTIAIFLSMFLVPLVLILNDYLNIQTVVFIGAICQTVAYIGASFSTKLYQLYLSQGLLMGISYALLLSPACIVLPTWFLKKRSLAFSIGVAGTGLGGAIFNVSAQALIDKTNDHRWALRMIGIVTGVLCLVSAVLIRTRKPLLIVNDNDSTSNDPLIQKKSFQASFSKIFDLAIWKNKHLFLVSIWFSLCGCLGYVSINYSLSNYGISIGLTPYQASICVTIFDAGQVFGRPLIGYLSDRYGRVNMAILFCFLTFLLTYCFWIPATTYASLLVFSFVAGFVVCVPWTSYVPLGSDIVGAVNFPSAFSILNVISSGFALVAEIITLELRDYSISKPFLWCQIYIGLLYLTSIIFLIPIREYKVRLLLNAKGPENSRLLKSDLKSYFKRVIYNTIV